uniref:Tat-binding homolog 7 n=1 Tax=Meloidogyne enterolobii TaxID=390850 RepID=A0A6V7Y0W2_MELEN|nr:unnamed protein product [Meloidogyne enterolobii]
MPKRKRILIDSEDGEEIDSEEDEEEKESRRYPRRAISKLSSKNRPLRRSRRVRRPLHMFTEDEEMEYEEDEEEESHRYPRRSRNKIKNEEMIYEEDDDEEVLEKESRRYPRRSSNKIKSEEMVYEEDDDDEEEVSRRYPRRASNKIKNEEMVYEEEEDDEEEESHQYPRRSSNKIKEDEMDYEEDEDEEPRRYPRRSNNKSKSRPLRRSRRRRRQVFGTSRRNNSLLSSYKINHLQRLPLNSVLDIRRNQSRSVVPHRHRKLDHCSSSTVSSTSTSSNEAPTEAPVGKRTTRHRALPKDLRDEANFEKRKLQSLMKGRRELMPINVNEKEAKTCSILSMAQENVRRKANRSSCADIDPMSIDHDVGFEQIGGLSRHIQQLKEMCLFPMLYPHVFEHFSIQAPKGVLFYGPPGTGKTLVARALANECSRSCEGTSNLTEDTNITSSSMRKRVAFFMRKGADCLSKWVGESERQLRLLFDQAYRMRPSIIFFDEIDGLAPVRSSRQDQIHSSIVSTLLALMDGIDSRGEVIVIGATNRLDSIDPALRRPGRFDRELRFDLPDCIARNQILQIHTRKWPEECQLSTELREWLAEECSGYCGADLKALCTESVLIAMRERYPHIYLSEEKLHLDPTQIRVSRQHFVDALRVILPASRRDGTLISMTRSNKASLLTLIMPTINELMTSKIPFGYQRRNDDDLTTYKNGNNNLSRDQQLEQILLAIKARSSVPAARLLLHGSSNSGQGTLFFSALLSRLDHLPIFLLNCEQLFSGGIAGTPEEQIQQTCRRARLSTGQGTPVVLAMPDLDLISSLSAFTGFNSALLLAAVQKEYEYLSDDIKQLFRSRHAFPILLPNYSAIQNFFDAIVKQATEHPFRFKFRDCPEPPKAQHVDPSQQPPIRRVTKAEFKELNKIYSQMLREFRIFLRDLLRQLIRDQRFKCFHLPVDKSDVPDYYDIIKEPMSLSQMMLNIDMLKYDSPEPFMHDLRLIRDNAIEYNPDHEMEDLQIKHTGRWLVEMAEALFEMELNDDFKEKLEDARNLIEEAAHSLNQQNKDQQEKVSNTNEDIAQPLLPSVTSTPPKNSDNNLEEALQNGHASVKFPANRSKRERSSKKSSVDTSEASSSKTINSAEALEVEEKECSSPSSSNSNHSTNGFINGFIKSSLNINGELENGRDNAVEIEPDFILDLHSLKTVVEKAVVKSTTEAWHVPAIESLGAELDQIIGEFRNEWNRSQLPQRLLACIESFQI